MRPRRRRRTTPAPVTARARHRDCAPSMRARPRWMRGARAARRREAWTSRNAAAATARVRVHKNTRVPVNCALIRNMYLGVESYRCVFMQSMGQCAVLCNHLILYNSSFGTWYIQRAWRRRVARSRRTFARLERVRSEIVRSLSCSNIATFRVRTRRTYAHVCLCL